MVTRRGPVPLVVEISDDPDPGPAMAALEAVAGSSRLVVDRTGTSFRGAVVGRDLLPGDHLVPADGRARPGLAALAGPLRGDWAVADRELVIGRGGRFGDRTVDDTEISRAHLRVSPTPGGLRATDAGSTNGTLHNDQPVEERVELRSGDRIEIGGSTLVVVGDPPRGPHVRSVDGAVQIRCHDQLPPPMPAERADPEPQVGTGRRRFGRRAPDGGDHEARVRTEAATVWAQGQEQVAWCRGLWPDPAHVAAAVAGWSSALWTRHRTHPAYLTVRIGEASHLPPGEHAPGAAPLSVAVPPAALGTGAAGHLAAPWVIDLRAPGPVGITGSPLARADHVGAWLLHLAGLHRPDDLELLVVPAQGSNGFRSLVEAGRWLPHGGARSTTAAPPDPDRPGPGRRSVAFVELVDPASAGAQEQQLAQVDRTLVWVAGSPADLPAACTTTIEIADSAGSATWRRHTRDPDGQPRLAVGEMIPDLVAGRVLDDLSRLLAPMVAVGQEGWAGG